MIFCSCLLTGSVIIFCDLCMYLYLLYHLHIVQTSGGRQESSCQTVGDPAPATTQSDKGAGLKVDKYSCM